MCDFLLILCAQVIRRNQREKGDTEMTAERLGFSPLPLVTVPHQDCEGDATSKS